ncbi:5'-3' exonuclease [Oikeobacillus pervagus]|uniref:5'-3' exonuclease n=1 Tax=Oikeobacillus pervagus TaxID=1325931 RepID=A0AAJ1WHS6_9BACI|nr:5'-3' exonuclease H3TH domain-containing protein [Oikeobacillus pervagus]MDQ0213628.1 5'-3' exonuclease [Oikeobacillus pervagus]
MRKQHLLLVDGMALLFRAFFATSVTGQYMVNSKGVPTNAVQGFMKHLLLAVRKTTPTHVAVCWDMGNHTFRNEIYPSYKGNREAPPVELIPQFDLAKEVSEAFALPNIGVVGYEADDCIGTISNIEKKDRKVTILSGDHDLLQLLDDQIDVMLLKKGYGNYQFQTIQSFYDEFKITPRQFIDVKALMGDASDGYPGVKGIGEKTALKLIHQYHSIEGILDNIQHLTPSQRKKIEQDLDMLHLSRRLAEIHREVPLKWNIDEAIIKGLSSEAIHIVESLELKSVRRMLMEMERQEEIKRA